jgi:hypothetical protein
MLLPATPYIDDHSCWLLLRLLLQLRATAVTAHAVAALYAAAAVTAAVMQVHHAPALCLISAYCDSEGAKVPLLLLLHVASKSR